MTTHASDISAPDVTIALIARYLGSYHMVRYIHEYFNIDILTGTKQILALRESDACFVTNTFETTVTDED